MTPKISKEGKRELLDVLRLRYQRATKADKGKILDEFVAVAGCHRKHAIRLLTSSEPLAADVTVVPRRTYDEAVREALIVLWEAADRICGKRLEAVLPGLVAALERHGHLHLDPVVRYFEIDFVSHGGTSVQGVFLWSLVATDVCSGWTEAVALVAREQSLVVEGLEVLRRQFPIPIKGIDSDNDSAYINETLLAYCQ